MNVSSFLRRLSPVRLMAGTTAALAVVGSGISHKCCGDPAIGAVDAVDAVEAPIRSANLIPSLSPEASLAEKCLACKELAIKGDSSSVPALAKLLDDQRLSHMARYALEQIAGPAAEQALLAAVDKTHGAQRLGVISSLGARRAESAVPRLGELLKAGGEDPETSPPTAAALGGIATPAAAEVLLAALDSAPSDRAEFIGNVSNACLHCASLLARRGDAAAATQLYEAVTRSSASAQLQRVATLGLARLTPAERMPARFSELLASPDDTAFQIALQLANELPSEEFNAALAQTLGSASPPRQVQLLAALGHRVGRGALPEVVRAASSAAPEVQAAALKCLGMIGDQSVVALLVESAGGDEPAVASAALTSLANLPGREIEAALMARLDAPGTRGRRVAVEALGRRNSSAAADRLFALAGDHDDALRQATLRSLGQTVNSATFPKLLDLAAESRHNADGPVVREAVAAASRRLPSPEQAVELISRRLATWPSGKRPMLLEFLGAVGGPQALAVVTQATASSDEAVADAATRVLGQWLGPEAADPLLALAISDHRHRNRALRGYLRIARQFSFPPAERLAMSRSALHAARRPEERRLAVELLDRCPSPESLALAESLLSDVAVRDAAAETALAIAETIKPSHPREASAAARRIAELPLSDKLVSRARLLLASP